MSVTTSRVKRFTIPLPEKNENISPSMENAKMEIYILSRIFTYFQKKLPQVYTLTKDEYVNDENINYQFWLKQIWNYINKEQLQSYIWLYLSTDTYKTKYDNIPFFKYRKEDDQYGCYIWNIIAKLDDSIDLSPFLTVDFFRNVTKVNTEQSLLNAHSYYDLEKCVRFMLKHKKEMQFETIHFIAKYAYSKNNEMISDALTEGLAPLKRPKSSIPSLLSAPKDITMKDIAYGITKDDLYYAKLLINREIISRKLLKNEDKISRQTFTNHILKFIKTVYTIYGFQDFSIFNREHPYFDVVNNLRKYITYSLEMEYDYSYRRYSI